MKYYMIDAFTDELFKGNTAGVCLPDCELTAETMQSIAFENNISETAFLTQKNGLYHLRWFTPEMEVDLCGHATLAAAFVVLNYVHPHLSNIAFETQSGRLTVSRTADIYSMDFPSRMPAPAAVPPQLSAALGCNVLEAHLSRDLLAIVENETAVRELNANIPLLGEISRELSFAVIVSAVGENCDFVSRFFAPNAGIWEDPVTGSAHCTLTPFWSRRLGKSKLTAQQLSPRGGTLFCEDMGERVSISGKAVCYLSGEIKL